MSHKVSLNRIIGNVAGNLGLENVNEVIEDFARWAAEGVTKIGSKNSYRRIECELEIKNFKASLPKNFAYPIAFKYKSSYLDVTKRDFRDFSKGNGGNLLPNTDVNNFNNNQKIVDTPGVPLVLRIEFIGVFTAGETISITVATNDCGNVYLNTFSYIVQIGDTPITIATEFDNQFTAISNLPYTSLASGPNLDLTGKTAEISFTVTIAENSILGSVDQCVIQKRVAPKKRTIEVDSSGKQVRTTSDNLASRDVVRLNTGMTSTAASASSYYGFGIGGSANANVFAIDNGCINFNALDGEVIGIAYMGIEVDEEGWPLIYWEHEDAVTHYIQFMLLSKDYYKNKIPQHIFKNAEQRWFHLCAQARGDDEMPDATEMTYLANMWNQLVPLPNKNNF